MTDWWPWGLRLSEAASRNIILLPDCRAKGWSLKAEGHVRHGSPWDIRDTQACHILASTLRCLDLCLNKRQSNVISVLHKENWGCEEPGDLLELGEIAEQRWEWTKDAPVGYFNLRSLHFYFKKARWVKVFLWSLLWTGLRPSIYFTSITNQPLNAMAFILPIDLVCNQTRDLEMRTMLYLINRPLSHPIPR